ncbi:hypothetical protein HPB52_010990 [Rhipicephalus sanguineus]|uniref:Mutator-like transposase domain-containing protein n=1 Tax=Rhipicephalus sanguineus TaxID=34632 RepID=A0A9D4PL85_RHISA|nr:hypothetical protein HPB52_010990 [Rhipicephalus sanguineus]
MRQWMPSPKNLDNSRELTKSEVVEGHITVLYDGRNEVTKAIMALAQLCPSTLDFEFLSNFCLVGKRLCQMKRGKLGKHFKALSVSEMLTLWPHATEEQFTAWVWQRSQSSGTPMLFKTFLSDGDSKAYAAALEANVYGGAVSTGKEDCANLVAKRLGTALRKLKEPLPRGRG